MKEKKLEEDLNKIKELNSKMRVGSAVPGSSSVSPQRTPGNEFSDQYFSNQQSPA